MTYRELDRSANRLARYLNDMGAGPGTLVGVNAERGVAADPEGTRRPAGT